MLAYNCSPSFNWRKSIPGDQELKDFQRELGKMGFKFQFITLAGFHQTNYSVFDFANRYKDEGMYAYSLLQEAEFAAESRGYTGAKHQREVGVSYFDAITTTLGSKSTAAMAGSTEEGQF
jgi:isocitrate lyase